MPCHVARPPTQVAGPVAMSEDGGAAAEAEAPAMMGPPRDESGFPMLPMLGGEMAELINSTTPQQLVMLSTSVGGGFGLTGMGALGQEPAPLPCA